MSHSDSLDEISKLFRGEIDGFERMIRETPGKIGSLDTAEIVRCYYQVMSMSSIIRALKPQIRGQDGELAGQVAGVERRIREEFDCGIHPAIVSHMSESIDLQVASLKSSRKAGQKTTEEVKGEAGLFERLREAMSTREFVEQYGRGLDHD